MPNGQGVYVYADGSRFTVYPSVSLPLILPGQPHGVRAEVERAALASRSSLDVVMEIDALDQIKALVANLKESIPEIKFSMLKAMKNVKTSHLLDARLPPMARRPAADPARRGC